MTGTGTIINVAAVIVGATLGALLGERMPERFRLIVVQGIGLVVIVVALDMALEVNKILVVLSSISLGALLGEWWDLQRRMDQVGGWMERKAERYPFLTRGNFTRGFVSTSLIICVGPLAILGSIQDGLNHDFTLLAIKSVMDLFICMAFAAAMGMGVAFSALSILLVQGSLTLGASLFQGIMSEAVVSELSATGGVILLAVGLVILEIKRIKVANFLPALVFVPLLAWLWEYFKLP